MPFSNCHLVFVFFPPLKTQIQVSEYQEAIYGSHKIQIFINITQATVEVLDKHYQCLRKKLLVLKVASSNMSHINPLFTSSRNQNGGKPYCHSAEHHMTKNAAQRVMNPHKCHRIKTPIKQLSYSLK